MNIHEYQAKVVLREFGIPIPRGIPAFTVAEAEKAAHQLGGPVWVVKAQIHAGGRGKAGGVKVVNSIEEVTREAARILGSSLVTHQTGPNGKVVNRLYIEEGSTIEKELYLSALVDRFTSRVAFVASIAGVMDIEGHARAAGESLRLLDRPRHRHHAASRPAAGASAATERRACQTSGRITRQALRRLRRQGYELAGNQSLGGDQDGASRVPRRQDQL